MFSTRWDDDRISVLDTVFRAVNNHFSFSFLKPKELVNVLMRFFTYFFTRLNAHEYELTVFSRVKYTAEIGVLLRFFLNGDYISLQINHLNLLQHKIPYQDFGHTSQLMNFLSCDWIRSFSSGNDIQMPPMIQWSYSTISKS
jgi:hypothetical protein